MMMRWMCYGENISVDKQERLHQIAVAKGINVLDECLMRR